MTPMSGKRDKTAPTPPAVPENAKRELGIGTFAGLMFAEAMSSVRLFGLGERVGFPWYLAWLLPGALDIYAITMVRFFSRLPAALPLRRKAAREAIIALVITVGCNALYETILQFSRQLPAWAPGVLFVLVSSLPPFVAGRLIHFRSEVGNGIHAEPSAVIESTIERQQKAAPAQRGTGIPNALAPALDPAPAPALQDSGPGTGTGTGTGKTPALDPPIPAAVEEPGTGNVVALNGNGRRSTRDWAILSMPYYRQHIAEHGEPPKAPKLAQKLRDAHPDLPVPKSERWERNLRSAADEIAESGDIEPDRDLEVAS